MGILVAKNQIHVFFVMSQNSPPDDPAEQQILVDAAGFWWILVDSGGFWWIKAVRVLCWDNLFFGFGRFLVLF